MLCKVNVKVIIENDTFYRLELWDLDPLFDDKITERQINNSGFYEFLFDSRITGEITPELEIRIFNDQDELVYSTTSENHINAIGLNRVDKTTVDFGEIIVK